jgi:hypothetical protein
MEFAKVILLLAFTNSLLHAAAQKGGAKTGKDLQLDFYKRQLLGLHIGAGANKYVLENADWRQGTVNYNDSLKSIDSKIVFLFEVGLNYQLNLSQKFAVRPAMTLSFEGGQVRYTKIQTTEVIKYSTISYLLSCPVLLKLPKENVQPYFTIGPSFLYVLAGDERTGKPFEIDKIDLMTDVGFGMDIKAKKTIVTPELRYSRGLTNIKARQDNLFSNTIKSFHRQKLMLVFYFRT